MTRGAGRRKAEQFFDAWIDVGRSSTVVRVHHVNDGHSLDQLAVAGLRVQQGVPGCHLPGHVAWIDEQQRLARMTVQRCMVGGSPGQVWKVISASAGQRANWRTGDVRERRMERARLRSTAKND